MARGAWLVAAAEAAVALVLGACGGPQPFADAAGDAADPCASWATPGPRGARLAMWAACGTALRCPDGGSCQGIVPAGTPACGDGLFCQTLAPPTGTLQRGVCAPSCATAACAVGACVEGQCLLECGDGGACPAPLACESVGGRSLCVQPTACR